MRHSTDFGSPINDIVNTETIKKCRKFILLKVHKTCDIRNDTQNVNTLTICVPSFVQFLDTRFFQNLNLSYVQENYTPPEMIFDDFAH